MLSPRLLAAAASFSIVLGLGPAAKAEPPSTHAEPESEVPDVRGPSGGEGARSTIDPRTQRIAQRLLTIARPHEGAIVVSEVKTGRILAWASYGGSQDWVATPHAPSASLFKLVTATALLERGHVTPQTTQCWTGGEHGLTLADLHATNGLRCAPFGDSLGRSINGIFARLSSRHLSASDLATQAALLGFAGRVPVDRPTGSSTVIIPNDELGKARAAAGFWNGHVSALGPLFAMSTIANDGERIRLRSVDRGDPDARVSMGRAMSVKTARALRSMLQITTQRGTCAKVFRNRDGSRALPGMAVAAKTGTLVGGKPSRMFSWFAGFAPANDPEIAVSVMLSNDVSWVRKGNQVGRDLLEAYFTHDRPRFSTARRRNR